MYSKLAVVAAVLLVAVAGARAEEYNCMAEGRVCQNGGVCHENALQTPESGTGNGWTTPFCVCQAPWGGPDCSRKIRECKDQPCQNGATCVAADCTSGSGNQQYDCFTCTCARGWTGAPSYGGGSGLCDWKLRPYEDCTATTCANGGTCTPYQANGYDSYQCSCTGGYRGGNPFDQGQLLNRPWNCTVPDCTLTAGSCLNGGSCNGAGNCNCINNYWGDRCEKAPFCASMPCTDGYTCQDNGDGTGTCQAPPFCSSNPCPNGATCSNAGGGSCTCVAPADGTRSCNGTQFCASNPCQNGASCTNTLSPQGGSGTCTCVEGSGYGGLFCEEQIKGCGYSNGGFPVGCSPYATGTPKCRCTDQASCASSNWNTRCNCGSAAPGQIFHYDCRCNSTAMSKCPGTSGTVTGQRADMVCQNGGSCVEGLDLTACSCRPGFWGDKCQNYDNPCLNNPCENGGQCYMTSETDGVPLDDRYWAYRCRCKWPYYGATCTEVAPIPGADGMAPTVCGAGNSPCQNGGTCSARGYDSTAGGFFYSNPWTGEQNEAQPWQCSCPLGWTGVMCEVAVPRCTATTCQNGGHCIDNSPAPTCSCPCGYAGDHCEIPASNAAASSLAQFAADNSGGVGYSLEFCSREPCQNGGTCYHSMNGQRFGCGCKSGYSGTYCQYRVRSAATGVVPSLIAVAAAVAVAFALKH